MKNLRPQTSDHKKRTVAAISASPLSNSFGKINILIIIMIVVIVTLVASNIYFIFLKGGDTEKKTDELKPIVNTQPEIIDAPTPNFGAKDYTKDFMLFPMGDLIVNPAGVEARFFITTITLEHRQSDKNLPNELKSKTPKIKHDLMMYFSRLTIEDLRDTDNREVFKEDVMKMVNSILLEGRITDVLFEQFVIQ